MVAGQLNYQDWYCQMSYKDFLAMVADAALATVITTSTLFTGS